MKTTLEMVREILSEGVPMTPSEVQHVLHARYNLWVSDSALTARMRDLRKERFGSYDIRTVAIPGKRHCRYQMVVEVKQAKLFA